MKKYYKLFIALLFISFIVPQIAFASWWNPFSWNIWNNIFSVFNKPQVVRIVSPIVSPNDSVVAEDASINTGTEQKKAKDKTKTENQTPPILTNPTPEPSCNPNWQTGSWNACQNGQQTRTVNDSNNCGIANDKPITTQSCTPPAPSVIAIDAFLANPTVENFKAFCTTAKTLQGTGERKVLNDTRTDYIMRKNTLYENVSICAATLGEEKDFLNGKLILVYWFNYDPLAIFTFENSNESDEIRESKVAFNSYWNDISKYKLIGINYIPENGVYTLDKIKESIATDTYRPRYGTKSSISQLFIVPEQLLSNLRTVLVKK